MLVGWSDLWLVFVQEFYSLKLQAPVGQQYSRKEWGRESIIDGKTEWQAESIARTSEALGQVCQHTWACGKIWGEKGKPLLGFVMEKGREAPGAATPDKTTDQEQLSQCLEGVPTIHRSSSSSWISWIAPTPFTGAVRVSVQRAYLLLY